ncbi:hypothetical protein [Erwinia piriflorinigrans]|uniref:Uncharacterized protein n=1 Tax=Erwinia piriflorinigrans CFBP 5888 TaxID=1161919 RepID=V5Z805_9GAMM|nr:hypothetical protein [Erwinia piriflorinigrans]CCG87057.1 hypothetical protein EPIR_1692 [Erwinia piriflorinigrans CFBP 5888]
MRLITSEELPAETHADVLIKLSQITRYRRLSSALERTLCQCSDIHFEFESRKDELQENYKKEGYATGLQLFFSQLTIMLDDYEQQYNLRMDTFKSLMIEAVSTSFDDPVIVERIVYHMKRICSQQNMHKVIIPQTVKLPAGADKSNYLFTDSSHITIQGEKDAIRFQSTPLCQQWLEQAALEMTEINDSIHKIIPDVLYGIGHKLISLSNQKNLTYFNLSREDNL